MRIAVASGKGGTGKTSLVACFAVLAEDVVLVDCDVDAANLHLVLEPTIEQSSPFIAGHTAIIRADLCRQGGDCEARGSYAGLSQPMRPQPAPDRTHRGRLRRSWCCSRGLDSFRTHMADAQIAVRSLIEFAPRHETAHTIAETWRRVSQILVASLLPKG